MRRFSFLGGHTNAHGGAVTAVAEDDREYVDDIDRSFSSRNNDKSQEGGDDYEDDDDDDDCHFSFSLNEGEDYDNENGGGGSFSKTSTQKTSPSKQRTKKHCTATTSCTQFQKRMGVSMLYLAVTAFCALAFYFVTRDLERDMFEQAYYAHATTILDTFQGKLESQLIALHSMSVSMTKKRPSGEDNEAYQPWPFVTSSNFAEQAINARIHADLLSVMLVPIVTDTKRQEWEAYSSQSYQTWVEEGVMYEGIQADDDDAEASFLMISSYDSSGGVTTSVPREEGSGPFYPIWQMSPARIPNMTLVNWDIGSNPNFSTGMNGIVLDGSSLEERAVISESFIINEGDSVDRTLIEALYNARKGLHHQNDGGDENALLLMTYQGEPLNNMYYPIIVDDNENKSGSKQRLVAVLATPLDWRVYLTNSLGAGGFTCVVTNDCGQIFTYSIEDDGRATYVGEGDLHDSRYDDMDLTLTPNTIHPGVLGKSFTIDDTYCPHTLTIYPSREMETKFYSNTPVLFMSVAIVAFLAYFAILVSYELNAKRPNIKVTSSKTIPTGDTSASGNEGPFDPHRDTSDSICEDDLNDTKHEPTKPVSVSDFASSVGSLGTISFSESENLYVGQSAKQRLKQFMKGQAPGATDESVSVTSSSDMPEKPLADFFPNCSVMFADIAGFSAWSSEREPEQIFTLLQTVNQEFDKLARRRRVFTVETIGDVYIAVTGMPEPQENHAIQIIKFSREIMKSMQEVTKQLEVSLGPDTTDLTLRVGVSSGPVTAGILGGGKSRFQLFGNTVSTASRLVSSCLPKKIQLSQSTADLLKEGGKEYWIKAREDNSGKDPGITANNKSNKNAQTYWIVPRTTSTTLLGTDSTHGGGKLSRQINQAKETSRSSGDALIWGDAKDLVRFNTGNSKVPKTQRFIDWQVELLTGMLKQLIEFREAVRLSGGSEYFPSEDDEEVEPISTETTLMDEVTESLTIPQIDHDVLTRARATEVSVELSHAATTQLRDYVTTICGLYKPNKFHNFEHANHVTASVAKLLSRVKEPDHLYDHDGAFATASDLHHYTYGITSDPLTQFAVVFSALIHDVDHPGVGNPQLSKEKPYLGVLYNNQSVAEQNSTELAWEMLMEPAYKDLQKCIYTNEDEQRRFRQMVVNIVLATDIFDKDMTAIRNRRWEKAFHRDDKAIQMTMEEDANLKATIVIEYLMQASDVSHTMQHWNVYTKWNERLFQEMMAAYEAGRAAKDPSEGWYKGELWFFDNYVLPLTKKLYECQVFGVSCDEYMNYALENRKHWESKGEDLVKSFVRNYHASKEQGTTTDGGLQQSEDKLF